MFAGAAVIVASRAANNEEKAAIVTRLLSNDMSSLGSMILACLHRLGWFVHRGHLDSNQKLPASGGKLEFASVVCRPNQNKPPSWSERECCWSDITAHSDI